MLTEIYIEALLVDECLADQVWEAWSRAELSDFVAAWAWWQVALNDRPSWTIVWSRGSVVTVARIGKDHPEKQKLIESCRQDAKLDGLILAAQAMMRGYANTQLTAVLTGTAVSARKCP